MRCSANGDAVVMAVASIMNQHGWPYLPFYIPSVMASLPQEMKGDDRVSELVRKMLNG